MKKITKLGIVVCLVALCLCGCGNKNTVTTEDSTSSEKYTNANDVIQSIKDAGVPVTYSIVYDSSNDPNGSNNHAYLQKGNFSDTRIESTYSKEEPLSGTVEIFENEQKAINRSEYLDKTSALDATYGYKIQYQNVLLRLNKKYTQTQIDEFTDILYGKSVEISTVKETSEEDAMKMGITNAINDILLQMLQPDVIISGNVTINKYDSKSNVVDVTYKSLKDKKINVLMIYYKENNKYDIGSMQNADNGHYYYSKGITSQSVDIYDYETDTLKTPASKSNEEVSKELAQ